MTKYYPQLALVVFCLCMISVVLKLYPVGDPHLPAYADFISENVPAADVPREGLSLALRYNRNSVADIGSKSVVCSVILDYRAYDTLFETIVLFTAIVAVAAIIGKPGH